MTEEILMDVLTVPADGVTLTVYTISLICKATLEKYSRKVKVKYVGTFKKEPDFYSVNFFRGEYLQET